ncbi:MULTISPECIES: hypothetical protein [Methylobacterium]|uniref:hypothetical protein n=1 Tax=Methylobacterium TaxID=407 RepID=UPI001FDEAE1C|nr:MULTISPECIES: hypothetical protein [Methylobacterium]MDR7039250.1 hypothetical protein [Methylobacterium sp. BE186]
MTRLGARGLLLAGALGGFLLSLAACESAVQHQRITLCRRAVPALVPGETDMRILRVGAGPAPDSVRVDYATGPRPHTALCRFNAGAELIAVTHDGTALNGAALYLLKRYYLDTPDAEAADPGEALRRN